MHICVHHTHYYRHVTILFIKSQLMAEKQHVTREKEQLITEKEQLITEKAQLQRELQTVNTRADEQIRQLQQQVSDIIVTSSHKSHRLSLLMFFIPSAVSHDDK